MSSPEQDLYALVSARLWDLLDHWRQQAQAALQALGPESGHEGTVLDGRLLQPIALDAIAAGDAAVSTLVAALKSVLPDASAAGVPVTLQGYDPGAGAPRGIALVLRAESPAAVLVAALTGAGPSGLAFEIAAIGAGAFGPAELPLANGWSIALQGSAGARLQLPRGAAASVIDDGTPASLGATLRYGGSPLTLGPAAGPHLSIEALEFDVVTSLDSNALPSVSYGLSLPGAQLSLATDLLAALIGDVLAIPLDLALAADALSGLSFKGAGMQATLPIALDLPGIDLQALELGMSANGAILGFDAAVAFTGGLPALPLGFSVDGLGASFPLALGSGALGIDPGAVRLQLPSGFGVDLTLPVLSGGGFVANTGPGVYGGVLSLDLIAASVQAFALLKLPQGGQPLGFVAILSLRFPPPGIQLGFGFSLNGVGGLVAINRRLDQAALTSALIDGSAEQLLFPIDPAAHGAAIVATLGRVFPAADGRLVIGPLLLIGWGGRILELTLAVVIELPDPVLLTIVGRLTLALPDPAAPLVRIEATVDGSFELSPDPSAIIHGGLAGSRLAGMPLDGDVLFMQKSGGDAFFVLSVGGFHPRYAVPAGVPANLHRMILDMTPPGVPGLRSEAYLALTSNSVQFGAHIELNDEIAGCGVDGWFNLDALFLWDPTFAFSASASAGVAVQVLGDTLMGISFNLTLEGPSPWHVYGGGSVDLFLFSIALPIDVRWGDPPETLPPPPDPGTLLAAAFADPSAWVGVPPRDDVSPVSLSAAAQRAVQGGQAVHPLGAVSVRQRAVPLATRLTRMQNRSITPQRWTLASAQLASDAPASLGEPNRDEFPPGEFIDLSEDEKLSRPAFEMLTSGAALSAGGVAASDLRLVDTSFEVVLIPDFTPATPAANQQWVALFAESLLGIDDLHRAVSLWSPPGLTGIVVLGAQPMALAATSTLTGVALAQPASGYTGLLQGAQAQFGLVGAAGSVQLVEAWELAA